MAGQFDAALNDGRRSPTRKAYEISHMTERHHEIARRLLLGQGNKEIASAMGITPQMVSIVRNSGCVREKLTTMSGARDLDSVDLAKEIRELAPKALQVMEEIMDDTSAPKHVRLAAARDMLDRAGFAPVKKLDVNSSHVVLSATDIEAMKKRAYSIAGDVIVDVTPE